ncbi:MAG: DUF2497 domain-containing protein [Alphaproteobacteria bacterium]|nr:DUF2497 domain-containing protein [Alphaproteobacteria bacterium]
MVGFNKKDEDMSMEDILSSIRKYVSEEDVSKSNKFASSQNEQQDNMNNDKVINLDASNIFPQNNDDNIKTGTIEPDPLQNYDIDDLINNNSNSTFNKRKNSVNNNSIEDGIISSQNESGQNSPFNKLAEALKAYGKQKKVKTTSELSYNMTVEQFLRTIVESYVQKWMNENLKKIVEQIVLKEVEKLKSE